MKRVAALLAIAMLATAPAHATTVFVAAIGEVTENQIVDSPLGDVAAGEGVVMSLTVDSNDFVDGASGDSRGYVISSFSLAFSGGVTVGLLVGGDTAYFTLADGMPVSDGFWVSTSPDSSGRGAAGTGTVQLNLDLGYEGDTLSSLDILDAGGVYDLDGLTRFAFTVWQLSPDFPAMNIAYSLLKIEPVPIPAALWLLGSSLLGLIGFRRRR